MAETSPTVSVVIPAHNAADTIARAIDSVLRQTYPPSQVIVVNDASTDNTRTRVSELSPQVDIVDVNERCVAGARNHGICSSRGLYIAFLDADDEWLPWKLETQLSWLAHHGLPVCLLGGPHIWRGNPIPSTALRVTRLSLAQILVDHRLGGLIAHRDALDILRGFDRSMRVCEDRDLFARAAAMGIPVFRHKERLTVAHEHPGSLTKDVRGLVDALMATTVLWDPRANNLSPLSRKEYDRVEAAVRMKCAYHLLRVGAREEAVQHAAAALRAKPSRSVASLARLCTASPVLSHHLLRLIATFQDRRRYR